MSSTTIILTLVVFICVLIIIILYELFTYKYGIQKKLSEISKDLAQIIDADSNEKVMVFTNNKILTHLLNEINRLILSRQRITAGYRHAENSSKKMIANISHDIKTPLTVILGYLEIMRLRSPEDETLLKIEKKTSQVMELINQFFSLAKLEAGDTNICISKVNINEICRESILDFYELLMQNEFQVDLLIPEKDLFVLGNDEAINRILYNLISNVIRYGSDGKFLQIIVRTEDSAVYTDVIDHGKGIEKAFAHHVFDRLFTMEDSRNRKIQGNGLGLTICKNLAWQMGGDIYLESIPNKKTVFTLKLKKAPEMKEKSKN